MTTASRAIEGSDAPKANIEESREIGVIKSQPQRFADF
jgi:hypothetical protein